MSAIVGEAAIPHGGVVPIASMPVGSTNVVGHVEIDVDPIVPDIVACIAYPNDEVLNLLEKGLGCTLA